MQRERLQRPAAEANEERGGLDRPACRQPGHRKPTGVAGGYLGAREHTAPNGVQGAEQRAGRLAGFWAVG